MDEAIKELGGRIAIEGADIVGVFLPHTRITSVQLARVATLPRLESIDLSAVYFNATSLSTDLLAWILAQPSIRSLQFNGADLDDSATSLAGIGSLTKVSLQGIALTDTSARQLLSATKLTALSVGATVRKRWWPNLSHAFPGYIISDALIYQADVPELRHIALRNTAITNESLRSIGAIENIE